MPLELFNMILGISISIATVITLVASGVRWLTKHYFEEIKKELRSFALLYKHRNQVETKHFPFVGHLADAIQRGQEHCNVMGYKFVQVRPFFIDLDLQEAHLKENRG